MKPLHPEANTKDDRSVGSSALLGLLEATTYNLWNAALTAPGAVHYDMYQRMKTPQIGDWVMEISSYRITKTNRRGVGILREIDGPIGSCATKFLIELPDGNLMRWSNAMVIAIPCEVHDWFRRPNAEISHAPSADKTQ